MRPRILLLLLLVGSLTAVDARKPRKRSFEGEYQWTQVASEGSLSAVFKRAGKDAWKVKYRFEFAGHTHEWKGEAAGSLSDGSEFSGTAGHNGRTWEIRGRVEDGVLKATHVETTGEREFETGTFVLRP